LYHTGLAGRVELEWALGGPLAEFREVHGREYFGFLHWYMARGGFDCLAKRWGIAWDGKRGVERGSEGSKSGGLQSMGSPGIQAAGGNEVVRQASGRGFSVDVPGEEEGDEVPSVGQGLATASLRLGVILGPGEERESEELFEEEEQQWSEDEEGDQEQQRQRQASRRQMKPLRGAKAYAALPIYKMSLKVGGRAMEVCRVAQGAVALYGSQEGSLLQWPDSFFYSNDLAKARLTKQAQST
jgi:hypothetical protein